MKQFSAAVIGLGKIGLGYDYDMCDDSMVLTHASGFVSHSGFTIIAGVDSDAVQRERFEKKYNKPAYASIEELSARCSPEVFSLAVPTSLHRQLFEMLIELKPLAIICEKPIAATVSDAVEMINLAEKSGCAVLVNYMRRFEPGLLSLRQAIKNDDLGKIYKGSVWYTKGFLNNGSHFVDLLQFLLGSVSSFKVISVGRKGFLGEPEPDVLIKVGDADIYFLSGREENFSLAELELVGTKGRVQYFSGGGLITTQHAEPDPNYSGYQRLGDTNQIDNDLLRYQWYVLEGLHQHLTQGSPLNSDGKSALDTLSVVGRIISTL